MRICSSSLLLLLAGGITFDNMPRSAAFFANTPFFDHTHSTGFAKRSRASSVFSKGIHIHNNKKGGDDTQSPMTTSPRFPQHAEGEFPVSSSTFSVIRDEDNDRTAILRERVNIEISEDDLAVLSELKGKISKQMNPYKDSNPLFGDIRAQTEGRFDPGSTSDTTYRRPDSVNVILFNPQTPDEGMHTIEFPKKSGNNIVLAFESRSECDRFAAQLAESGEKPFSDPVTYEMPTDALETYCENLGIFVQIVPAGTPDIRPPTSTSPVLGHNPNLHVERQTLDYLFDMVEITGKMDGDVESIKSVRSRGEDGSLEGMYWVGDVSSLDDEENCSIFSDDVIGCWD